MAGFEVLLVDDDADDEFEDALLVDESLLDEDSGLLVPEPSDPAPLPDDERESVR